MNRQLLTDYEKFVENRQNSNQQYVYSPFASTFKNARLSQRKTLFAVVGKTCSLSYISKYENNLITPDESVLRVLFDNVGIDYELLCSSNMSDAIPSIIKAYLRYDIAALEEYYIKSQTPFFIAQNALASLFYYLIKKQFTRCSEEIERIDNVKTTLNDYQLLVLGTATVEFFILTNRFKEARRILNIQKSIFKDNHDIKTLYLEQRFFVSITLKDNLNILENYSELQKTYNTYPIRKQIRNKIYFLETCWKEEFAYQEIIAMNSEYIPEECYHDYLYSKYLIMLRRHEYELLINDFHLVNIKSISLLALYSYAILKLINLNHPHLTKKYQEEKLNLEREFNKIIFERFYEQEYLFIKLVIMQINKISTLDICDYMKANIVPKIEASQHRFYTEYYVNTYLNILKQLARYKEALIFAEKYIEYVNPLN